MVFVHIIHMVAQGSKGTCPKLQSQAETVIAFYELASEVMQYHLSLFICKKQSLNPAHNQEQGNQTQPFDGRSGKEFGNMF